MKSKFGTVVPVIFLAACSPQSPGIGSYVASDANTAMMVQITSNENGSVTGTVSMVNSDENGRTQAVTRPFSGTLEKTAVNLSFENGRGLLLATGILDEEKLNLTLFGNGGSSRVTLFRKDASEFDKLVSGTRMRSAVKRQETEALAAQKDRIGQRSKTQKAINKLSDRLLSKSVEISEKAKKLETVIQTYRSAQGRMSKLLTAKRAIAPNSDDALYLAGSIDYDIKSISDDIESLHSDVESYSNSLSRFIVSSSSEASTFIAECERDSLLDCSRLKLAANQMTMRAQEFHNRLPREKTAFGQAYRGKS